MVSKFPGTCVVCEAPIISGEEIGDTGLRGPQGGKKMAHARCLTGIRPNPPVQEEQLGGRTVFAVYDAAGRPTGKYAFSPEKARAIEARVLSGSALAPTPAGGEAGWTRAYNNPDHGLEIHGMIPPGSKVEDHLWGYRIHWVGPLYPTPAALNAILDRVQSQGFEVAVDTRAGVVIIYKRGTAAKHISESGAFNNPRKKRRATRSGHHRRGTTR